MSHDPSHSHSHRYYDPSHLEHFGEIGTARAGLAEKFFAWYGAVMGDGADLGLRIGYSFEDELVGIYYYLGRAYEALQNRASAVEFYDRVFSLDINFADVTDRLRELR